MSRYWPDDAELQEELGELLAYRRLGRGRLRMVLEAIEDHLRGWRNGKSGLGEERVARGKLAIEHVMPQKWHRHWPLQDGHGEGDRDRIIHTLGNLTLLTGKLNSKVSNGPWLGTDGKRNGLEAHDVLLLNRELLKAVEEWTDDAIRSPNEGTRCCHRSDLASASKPPIGLQRPCSPDCGRRSTCSDLINGGALQPGMSLFPRRKKYSHQVATLLQDGQVEVDGVAFSSASDAANAIAGKRTNGWWFFLTDQASRRTLRRVRDDYVNAMAVDVEDDEADDDEDEE